MRAQVLSICSSAASTSVRLKPCVEVLADRPDVGLLRAKALIVEPGVARQKTHVERRHPHRRGRHLLEIAHPGAHLGALRHIGGRQARGRVLFVQVFANHAGIDDHVIAVHERRHHAVRVELEIFRLELILSLTEVEPDVLE
jgi:hypothetical protein